MNYSKYLEVCGWILPLARWHCEYTVSSLLVCRLHNDAVSIGKLLRWKPVSNNITKKTGWWQLTGAIKFQVVTESVLASQWTVSEGDDMVQNVMTEIRPSVNVNDEGEQ